ncbi:hypothetical protein PUN28_011853 [Cardiocondyla obscurior]|uniref:Uncharacterized protein n=1 Tax=Cardiocondyla obscurior TaxID=286306 RepID=A0AAW2FLL2_9HYME
MIENEFKIEENENTEKNNLKSNEKINKIKLENKDYNNDKGMLGKVNENDNYYEQYTIYSLYEKKINKSVLVLFEDIRSHFIGEYILYLEETVFLIFREYNDDKHRYALYDYEKQGFQQSFSLRCCRKIV